MSGKAYGRKMGLASMAYALVTLPVLASIDRGWVAGPALVPVVLLPMLPALAMAWLVWQQFRRMDELQRRIQGEAIMLAFVGTALLSLTYGFLESAGLPRLPMVTVWAVMGTLWLVATRLVARSYR
ncbi:hypothetical protein HHL28_16445 [Aerophototrophica crusticola]|uniref:Uncharacterized protein n=1 Tax=Aerophototrophica crusticola TaxID=1709002 RepID=A0A858RBQ6_9PROT|nr:hypothetical protein HHL28_16445 [Rhodospirillaceae bacterium B3]